MVMLQWVIQEQLARGRRPGYTSERDVPVATVDVDTWIQEAKDYGIQSIICLLSEDQLGLYAALPTDLVSYYRQKSFQVEHVPVRDHQWSPLSEDHLQKVWDAYKRLPKPILVHCSAGVDRTGRAVDHIKRQLEAYRD
jgi:protein-tyrosine phosphatase